MAEQIRTRDATAMSDDTPRRHIRRQPFDRRELERRGWRTTLDYRENHQRDAGGVLGSVVAHWRAEGERIGAAGEVIVVTASGPSPAAAWKRLRAAADSAPAATSSAPIRSVPRR